MKKRLIAAATRLLLPVGILAVGWYAYDRLSVPVEQEVAEVAEPKKIRSRVQKLVPGDYQVTIRSNGIVEPHNQVTLSAEVTGRVSVVHRRFDVGSYFQFGDVLLELDDRDYKSALRVAREQHRLAESTLQLADAAYQRLKELARRNNTSRAELDIALSELVNARSQVEITDEAINRAERDLQRTKITAPFDGRVVSRDVGLGQLISPGMMVGQIFAVDFAEVRLPIATRQLRNLDLPEMEGDRPVQVQLHDAIDPANDRVWPAEIVRTEGALDANSLELFAIARINDPFALRSKRPILRIGQPVTATIDGERLENVIAIPRDSVRRLDQIYLIDPETRKLRSRTIRPLWTDERYVVVAASEIEPGDLLATTMLVYAPEGAEVTIIPDPDTDALAGDPTAKDLTQ